MACMIEYYAFQKNEYSVYSEFWIYEKHIQRVLSYKKDMPIIYYNSISNNYIIFI